MRVPQIVFTILIVFFLIAGCSKANSPVTGDILEEPSGVLDSIPIIATGENNAIGLFGAYTLSISADRTEVELTPMRTPSIGEGYIVSGLSFFTIMPCSDCLKWDGEIKWFGDKRLILPMSVTHPFDKGDPEEDPTARNRLDLDIFDLALLVKPRDFPKTNFPELETDAYTGFLYNPDGFTKELSAVLVDTIALPYKICYEDPDNNRFQMGTKDHPFDLILDLSQSPGFSLRYDLYMTMGYGFSAKKLDRLDPTYYVPEFNRKAAWKVHVTASQWDEDDMTDARPITIDIYDWNHGADINSNYPDSNLDEIPSSSNIDLVEVEIPGMFDGIVSTNTTDDINFNGWDDPITYTVEVANEKDLPEGAYAGLVRVTDSRTPGTSIVGGETDTLVDSPDGIDLIWFDMPEFATYQSFMATVRADTELYTGGVSFGGVGLSIAVDDITGEIYVAGYFEGTVDFGDGDITSNGGTDAFLSKFNRGWNFQWAYTWGGHKDDEAHSVVIDGDDNVYITGYFQGQDVSLDPIGGSGSHDSLGDGDVFLIKINWSQTFGWAESWGAGIWDEGHGLAIDALGVYVTGYFQNTVDFGDGFPIASNGAKDVFVSKFQPNNGALLWVKTWGGGPGYDDEGHDVVKQPLTDNFYVTGYFQGTNVNFDTNGGSDHHSSMGGSRDVFLSKFYYDETFIWAKTWGGSIWDEAHGVAADDDAVYVTGCFEDTVDFDPSGGIVEWTSNGEKDVFLSKFFNDGSLHWAKAWGGGIWDEGHGLAVDDTGIYVTGFFGQTVDFDPGPDTNLHIANTGKDVFLSKFAHNFFGSLLWARTWESTDDSLGNDLGSGSVYLVGEFTGFMDMDPGPGEDWQHSSDSSVFVTRLTAQGNYETEPNDDCGTANPISHDSLCNGFIQEDFDAGDYWVYTTDPFGENLDIYLYNYSGYDIDLYFYNFNCLIQEGISTLPSGSDEHINVNVLPSTEYRIYVRFVTDGYSGPKEYGLYVYETG